MTEERIKLNGIEKVAVCVIVGGVLFGAGYIGRLAYREYVSGKKRSEVRKRFEEIVLQNAYYNIGVQYTPRDGDDGRLPPEKDEADKMRRYLGK